MIRPPLLDNISVLCRTLHTRESHEARACAYVCACSAAGAYYHSSGHCVCMHTLPSADAAHTTCVPRMMYHEASRCGAKLPSAAAQHRLLCQHRCAWAPSHLTAARHGRAAPPTSRTGPSAPLENSCRCWLAYSSSHTWPVRLTSGASIFYIRGFVPTPACSARWNAASVGRRCTGHLQLCSATVLPLTHSLRDLSYILKELL